ncbi:MAG: patatin family protein [Clostridiales bacterium]|nr:patatin family protein [Clostridiales bacterium]
MELKNCGLVLEGGSVRGVFTAGVLDYLMEQDFYSRYVVGVSAGACNAAGYVSRQIRRTRDCFIPASKEWQYLHLRNILRHKPVYDMDFTFDQMQKELYPFDFETYSKNQMECELVVTNVSTGQAEYLDDRKDSDRLLRICRASSSLALFANMVELDGQLYMDGGYSDSIPYERAQKKGCKKLVVVLTKHRGYVKKPVSRAKKALYRKEYGKYDKFYEAIINRVDAYNKSLRKLEKMEDAGEVFVLRPQIPLISKVEQNREKLEAFYQHGYEQMKEQFEKLQAYLER